MSHLLNIKDYDTAIVGGGVLGLWAARHAVARGERTILFEKRKIGSGASGGFLGALMPHMPDNWNDKKQFQYEGLTSLAEAVATLEEETGLDCGYRQCGRLMPVPHEKLLTQIDRRIEGARTNWEERFELSLRSAEEGDVWVNPAHAPYGLQRDTISARINPRAYLRALEQSVRPDAEIHEHQEVVAIDMESGGGTLTLKDGQKIKVGKIIVANGYEAYPLLQAFLGPMNSGKPIGRGVKGQAVLLELEHRDEMPIVYHDGVYVVPHAGNRIAVGSTSLNDWEGQSPDGFDELDQDFLCRARDLVPAIDKAPVIGRWAGVRPRNTIDRRGTEPWFGPVPGQENLIALIGGFKITLGIAHVAEKGFF